MGTIILDRIELFGKHGAFAFEKKIRQKFYVTVSFDIDFLPAAKTDDLQKTVDYTSITKICDSVMQESRCLLETLAVEMVDKITLAYPQVRNLRVCIEKPGVQLGHTLNTVKICHSING